VAIALAFAMSTLSALAQDDGGPPAKGGPGGEGKGAGLKGGPGGGATGGAEAQPKGSRPPSE